MSLMPLTDERREELNAQNVQGGLVIESVDPESDAATKGLMPGDVITEVGQQPVSEVSDFETRVSEAEDAGQKSILLLIRRDGNPRFVALSLEDG